MGRPFHPQAAELRVAPSPRLATGVSFLFRGPPSPAVPLGTMHPAMREELPQETPVARPPTRVRAANRRVGLRVFPFIELGKELALQLQDLRLRPRVLVGFKRLVVQGLEGRAPLVEREEPLRLRLLSEDEERCSERLEGAQDTKPRVVRGVGREQPGEAAMLPPEFPEEDLLRLLPG